MARKIRTSGRRTFPPRRALLGGGLITIAALGVFTAHRGADKTPGSRFIVAMHAIEAGTVIRADDLGSMALDLPGEVPAIATADADLVVGRVASGTIAEFELVNESDLYPADHLRPPGATILALDMTPARAMFGVVAAGDRVSVLSTDPQGSGTTHLSTDALVVSIDATSVDSIGASGTVRVVLSLTDTTEATAITDASITSELTLQVVTDTTEDTGAPAVGSSDEPAAAPQETP